MWFAYRAMKTGGERLWDLWGSRGTLVSSKKVMRSLVEKAARLNQMKCSGKQARTLDWMCTLLSLKWFIFVSTDLILLCGGGKATAHLFFIMLYLGFTQNYLDVSGVVVSVKVTCKMYKHLLYRRHHQMPCIHEFESLQQISGWLAVFSLFTDCTEQSTDQGRI